MSTQSRFTGADESHQQYLTVSQAAELLSVHPSTVRRWIDQGRLPAYRLGVKRIGVRTADLAGIIAPRAVRNETQESIKVSPLTAMARRQVLSAIEEARRHQEDLLGLRSGEVFPDSAELTREAREERTGELMRALEE